AATFAVLEAKLYTSAESWTGPEVRAAALSQFVSTSASEVVNTFMIGRLLQLNKDSEFVHLSERLIGSIMAGVANKYSMEMFVNRVEGIRKVNNLNEDMYFGGVNDFAAEMIMSNLVVPL